jgi:hypothetical protein
MTTSKRDLDFEREIMAEVERVSKPKADAEERREARQLIAKVQAENARKGNSRGHGDEPPAVDVYEYAADDAHEPEAPIAPSEPTIDGRKKNPNALKLTFFDELTEVKPKPWIIKNVIARGETSSWIAPPGKGKSSVLVDVAVHQAGNNNWRGYRTKDSFGTVFFALERADLTKRRLLAHRLRDDLPVLPIAVAGQVIDLMNRSCVDIILHTIWEAEQRFGREAGLAVIDTYSKGIAAGGGDEDKARDQNIALANLRRVLDRINIHIASIGHTGKDERRGERGSNARRADVDAVFQITGDRVKTITTSKGNDQAEGVVTSFQLEPFDFGPDEDGDPIQTFIVSKEIYTGTGKPTSPLSDRQELALRALVEVALSHGRDPPAEYRLPQGIKVITAEQWRAEVLRTNASIRGSKNPAARFNDLRDALARRGAIGSKDDLVWIAKP